MMILFYSIKLSQNQIASKSNHVKPYMRSTQQEVLKSEKNPKLKLLTYLFNPLSRSLIQSHRHIEPSLFNS